MSTEIYSVIRIMEETYKFLKQCAPFQVATIGEDGRPTSRIISLVEYIDGKIWLAVDDFKSYYRELNKNPDLCIIGMHKDS